MLFDPENKVVQLCARGMEQEGSGNYAAAAQLFQQAWDAASNHNEQFIAAHYLARHQKDAADKLKWDETALDAALKSGDETAKASLPSLYLNVAKGYEDLHDFGTARQHYTLGLESTLVLPDDGYSNMVRSGIESGLKRIGFFPKKNSP